MSPPLPPLIERRTRPDGTPGLKYNFHPGQMQAWASSKRVVAIIAGSRSGKTAFGAPWLHREMVTRGPGDYLVAAPSYPLLDKAAAPEVQHLFERLLGLGTLKRSPLRFDLSRAGCQALWGVVPERQPRVLFGHAEDPESLEAMTIKAAWLDECGQTRFRVGSWEAVNRRLAVDQGRVLLTTTPYALNWLKVQIHDPWEAAHRQHPDIDLIRFDALANPAFPPAEYERQRLLLPRWKFDMFYRGVFSRPAGLIYDSFDTARHVIPRHAVPPTWERFGGLDFGATNTAAVLFAQRPDGKLIAYREYRPGKREPAEHVRSLLLDEPRAPTFVGGSASENDWRQRFAEAGLSVRAPEIRDVEVGIDAVWACFQRGDLLIMDHLTGLLDELATYARVVDAQGEPTAAIDAKETYHYLDAVRYLVPWLKRDAVAGAWAPQQDAGRSVIAEAPPGVFAAEGW